MQPKPALATAVLFGSVLGAMITGRDEQPRSADPVEVAVSTAGRAAERTAELGAELGAEFDLPVVLNSTVQRFVHRFSEGSASDDMALYLKRSGRYEGMIRSKLRERGMPEDLFYLSLVESGFNTTARSSAKAVGLWQFVAETGRRYGLRVDGYVDERRDPEKSTDAALRYLNDLHDRFGAWTLAAAAYNTGENRVGRIMREETGSERGDEQDFWKIRHRLPRETRDYVPLIFAAALVGKQTERYGMQDVERWLPLAFDTVMVPGGTQLATVADAANTTSARLATLNPHLLRGSTPPGSKQHPIRVPAGRGDEYASNWERVQRAQLAAAARRREEVRKREVARLAAARSARRAKLASAARARSARSATAARRTHRVRQGESLWTIARRHDITVRRLQQANGLGSRSRIKPGQRLRIPV